MGSFQEGASFTIAIAFFFLFTKIPLLQFDMGYENNFFSFFFGKCVYLHFKKVRKIKEN